MTLQGLLARLRLLLGRRSAELRMNEECRFHVEMETEKNRRAGMPADEARRRALVDFGGVESHKEDMRDGRGLAWLSGWSLDLKLGARMLRKYPGLAIVGGFGIALATAIGVGAHAVLSTYMDPELPLPEAHRLFMVANQDVRNSNEEGWRPHDVAVWRDEVRSLNQVGAYRDLRRNVVSQVPGTPSEPVTIAEMTASGFRIAGSAPLLGRFLLDTDEERSAPPVVVIGYDEWVSRFERDTAIVGRTITFGSVVHQVVGVMPEGFAFPVNHSLWVPLRDMRGVPRSAGGLVFVFGTLAPGVTRAQAQAEIDVIGRRIGSESGTTYDWARRPRLLKFTELFSDSEGVVESAAMRVVVLMFASVLVLVCLNVAVLVYARTVTRTGEIAVRTALGASRARIVAQLFAEALVLSVLSAGVGLGLVAVGLAVLDVVLAGVTDLGRLPFWIDPGISPSTVAYTLGLAVLASLIVGVLPALRATGTQLRGAMNAMGSGARAQLGKTWSFFIVAQVAVAVAALPPALLKGWDFLKQSMVRPEFPAHEYLVAQFRIESDDPAAQAGVSRDAQAQLIARLDAEAGVAGTTIAQSIPGSEEFHYVATDGDTANTRDARIGRVDANYFAMFGVRVLAGRTFTSSDAAMRENRPVVVNRSFVDEVLGGAQAVGRRMRYRTWGGEDLPWQEIVGVVEDFPAGFKNPDDTPVRVYQLAVPGELQGGVVITRMHAQTPHSFTPSMRQIATSVNPALQMPRLVPLDVMYEERGRLLSLLALAVVLLIASVVLLSAAGIHAMMSFTVNQRRREIGVRAALGANARRILTGVLSRAAGQLVLGVVVGLAIALAMDRVTEGAFLSRKALVVLPSVAAFMIAVGLLAAAGPARRGLQVQPTEALRAEV